MKNLTGKLSYIRVIYSHFERRKILIVETLYAFGTVVYTHSNMRSMRAHFWAAFAVFLPLISLVWQHYPRMNTTGNRFEYIVQLTGKCSPKSRRIVNEIGKSRHSRILYWTGSVSGRSAGNSCIAAGRIVPKAMHWFYSHRLFAVYWWSCTTVGTRDTQFGVWVISCSAPM